ncbi:MAG TPA: hypothetical protein VEA69_14645 [Tepidisphaeraceae bacterium]|nr:hypothetical protein [Tepidisphaeraceae bacterium]
MSNPHWSRRRLGLALVAATLFLGGIGLAAASNVGNVWHYTGVVASLAGAVVADRAAAAPE